MQESYTFEIIDEILDVVGLGKKRLIDETLNTVELGVPKGMTERLNKIKRMPKSEFNKLADDLVMRQREFYKKSLNSIQEGLVSMRERPKAYYFGNTTPLAWSKKPKKPNDQLLRKTSIYYDKIVLENTLEHFLRFKERFREHFTKGYVATNLLFFAIYKPWMEHGVVEILPSPFLIDSISNVIQKIAYEDYKDEFRNPYSPYLKDEDRKLEGDALIQRYERFFDSARSREYIEKHNGLRMCVLRNLIQGKSIGLGSAFFGSLTTGTFPTTDRRRHWRLFGYWTTKRAEELVKRGDLSKEKCDRMMSRARLGRALIVFEPLELKTFMDLPVKKFLEARDSSELSLNAFRRDLNEVVQDIEKQNPDEKDYGDVVRNIWEGVVKESDKIKRDLIKYRKKLALGHIVPSVTCLFGLTSFNLQALALGLLSIIEPWYDFKIDMDETKRSSSYFLVRMKEEKETLEVLKERGVSSIWQL